LIRIIYSAQGAFTVRGGGGGGHFIVETRKESMINNNARKECVHYTGSSLGKSRTHIHGLQGIERYDGVFCSSYEDMMAYSASLMKI
jgi:hypothetical protein